MKKWMKAKIKWLTEREGGRRKPVPVNTVQTLDSKYCPIIRFLTNTIEIEDWSAEIYVEAQIGEYESFVRISFLFENAPFELFEEGADFQLYEGNKLVAMGVICSKKE